MALAHWSTRRIAAIWAVGIILQVALIAVPLVATIHIMRRDGPRLRREGTAREAALRGAERADSVSRAEQVAAARASNTFHIRADGETVFAVVGMPSGRPDPRQLAALRRSMRRKVGVLLGIQFGTIPIALALLTLAWVVARRQGDHPAAMPVGQG